ncbi:MAG: response regulator [Anaerolinea sp.]|nr:response regulator [Anaerolinea sp.]
MTQILVIEDELPLRAEVADILQFEGFDVLEAGDGRAGIALAREHHPALIVCDISMPELDGYTVLDELRRDQELARTPFMFLTARADRSFMRHGMELGADDYLTKPFTRGELLSAVQARLDRCAAISSSFTADLDEAKANLTRLVMRELQTPLVPMRMVSDVIQRQVDKLTPAILHDLMASMSASVDYLAHVVEQMVYLTHLETGILRQDAIAESGTTANLSHVLRRAVELSATYTHRSDIPVQIAISADGHVVAHTQALTRALAELIADAIQMSQSGVIVSLDYTPAVASVVISSRRANADAAETKLGIVMAHGIVEAHGGTVGARTDPDGRTEAVVTLPLSGKGND